MAKSLENEDGTLNKGAVEELLDDYEKTLPSAAAEEEKADAAEPDATEAGEGDAVVEGDSDEDWTAALSADLRELVESLEISEEELRDLSGPEELERHAKLHDKHIMRLGRTKPEEDEGESEEEPSPKPRDKNGRFVKADEVYEPSLSADEYDEAVVGEFKKVASHFGERIGRLEEMLQASEERAVAAERQQHDTLIDSLGHEDLFGNVDAPRSADQATNRQKLLESLDILRAGLTALGRRATVTPALMRRALNQEFAEKLSTKHRASLTKAIQKQGSRRLGGGKSKPSTLQSKAWSGDPERDPVLLEAYWEAAKEAGGR